MPCSRRHCLLALASTPAALWAADGPDAAWAALGAAAAPVVLFRHAEAPGVGDPAGFRLGDCRTQRNLSDRGRAQARALGERFRRHGVRVGRVLTSQWCRTRDTAALAFPGQVEDAPPFNSFFEAGERSDTQTAAARALLAAWTGPGALVVVTHQVNITALTDLVPASGEGVVVRVEGDRVVVTGRLPA
jgi:phosphohistidine phosphatase SixA